MKLIRSTSLILALTVALSALAGIVGHVFAAEDQFQVRLNVVGGDTQAPTAPTNLAATARSATQIDLVWDPASDDVGVDHYRVYREAKPVATVSDTSYEDTGLESNTTYAYTVSAVDGGGNESDRSATSTATTQLSQSEDDGGGAGGLLPIYYTDVTSSSTATSVTITWETNIATRGRVAWGATPDHELGAVLESFARREHVTTFTNLDPATDYHVNLTAYDHRGRSAERDLIVRTDESRDVTPPANVTGFRAYRADAGVELSWVNPTDEDFENVRIVRSDMFFPRDPRNGELVYEGPSTGAGNADVLIDGEAEPGETYYYTIFARDVSGNTSSGAIARVAARDDAAPADEPGVTPPDEPFEGIAFGDTVHPDLADLSLDTFEFLQEGELLSVVNHTVTLDAAKPLTIRIAYDKTPEVLKTIGVTMRDSTDPRKVFSFLLRVDDAKEYYTATIDSLEKEGRYEFEIFVLDYKNRGLVKLSGVAVAQHYTDLNDGAGAGSVVPITKRYGEHIILGLSTLFLLLLLLLAAYLLTRRRKKKEAEPPPENLVRGVRSSADV